MIRAVIIDDEVNSRELLHQMLADYISGVIVVGSGKDVASGVQVIHQKNPDLVFLDIEMPGGDGFNVLDAFEDIGFKVIFVTGFVEHALKAIKYSALDYILKPIDLSELKLAIQKVTRENHNITKNFKLFKSFGHSPANKQSTIVISGVKKQHFIQIDNLIAILIRDGNTIVCTKKGPEIITLLPLRHFEDLLPTQYFMRIHKSAIINLTQVLEIDHGRTGSVHLVKQLSIPFSSRKKTELLDRLKKTK